MCEVTIAIAMYNLEDYIQASLESALNQDFEDLEILVCDDCSTDHSIEVVKKVCKTHPNSRKVRVISPEKNSGTSVIRNMAIDLAQGKYICFLDGDDLIPPYAISTMVDMMTKTNADLVVGNLSDFEDGLSPSQVFGGISDSASFCTRFPERIINEKYAIARLMELNHTNYFNIGLVNKLYNLQFLKDNDIKCIPEHGVVDDIYFTSQCQLKVKSISTVCENTYYVRRRIGSATRSSISLDRMNLYLHIFDLICSDIQKENALIAPNKVPRQLYYILTRCYLYGYITNIILSSNNLSISNKSSYLKHISKIRRLDFTKKDILSRLNRVIYYLLQFRCRYWLVKFAFILFRILGKERF